ncbi:fibronectin type III domain-containing protein, partial [Candidatus Woesearchaeota archaeon]|nr:fibronectin type III domain-containing protein [Candidatus Woesearchaeota archaeon]
MAMPLVFSVLITHESLTDVTTQSGSAEIRWTTDADANSTVIYDTGSQEMNYSVSDSQLTKQHTLTMDGLISDTLYYYVIVSNDISTPAYTFRTNLSSGTFLNINALPERVNKNKINISGTTEANARFKIFVNKRTNTIPRVDKKANGDGLFNEEILLDTTFTSNNTQGYNLIEVDSWNGQGEKDTKLSVVIADIYPPRLIVNDFPEFIGKERSEKFNITGASEAGAKISVWMNNQSKGEIIVDENGMFSRTYSLGVAGKTARVTIVLEAVDIVGNRNRIEKTVTVDSEEPTLQITSDRTTHFQPYHLKGKTKANAKVKIKNIGEYFSIEEYRRAQRNVTAITALADPTGLIFGMERETTSNDNGEFDVWISLLMSAAKGETPNNFWINITDKAGNSKTFSEKVNYKPECSVWAIGRIEFYPMTIFSSYWNNGEIKGSVFFPIEYTGYEAINGDSVTIQAYIDTETNTEGRRLNVAVGGTVKRPKYDENKRQAYVYIPITIPRNTLPPSEMPDKIDIPLKVVIQYSLDNPVYA